MSLRKTLIKFAKRLELGWQAVDTQADAAKIDEGWYIAEFMIQGVLDNTPRVIVEDVQGKQYQRDLLGSHTGRNRRLIFLPAGHLIAYSDSIEFKELARVSNLEGRARVLLICFRYLLDFFSLPVVLKMLAMQFYNRLELSDELLKFYASNVDGGHYLSGVRVWDRYRGDEKQFGWRYRKLIIVVLIERESQRQALQELLLVPEQILSVGELAAGQRFIEFDYLIPLRVTEQLRFPAILMLKKALHGAIRSNKQKPLMVYTDHDYQLLESDNIDNGSFQTKTQTKTQEKVKGLPAFKPQPSLAYLHCFNYPGPAVLYSAEAIEQLFIKQLSLNRSSLDQLISLPKQYRLSLACFAKPERVLSISEALFNSSQDELQLVTPEPFSPQSAWPNIAWSRVKSESPDATYNTLRANADWQDQPAIDLIIPTRDGLTVLQPCVESILQKTDYANFNITIVDNGSQATETKAFFSRISEHDKVQIMEYPGRFNYSAINNFAISQTNADYIALINNDIEVMHSDWLTQMMVWAVQPNVGVVGAKLLFGNGKIQHAGVTIGMGNAAGHLHRLEAGEALGYQNRCVATQNMMAVTAACLVTSRDVFESMGGLDEKHLAVAYNDIDYCLRVEASGLDIIWTPEARLYHHESVTRGDDMSAQHVERYFKELGVFQKRWKTKGFVDKYYSKHLRIGDEGVYPKIERQVDDRLRYLSKPKESA